jgi:hypothetical protein
MSVSLRKANRLLKKRIKLAQTLLKARDSSGILEELDWRYPSDYYEYGRSLESTNFSVMSRALGLLGDVGVLPRFFEKCEKLGKLGHDDLALSWSRFGSPEYSLSVLLQDFQQFGAKAADYFASVLATSGQESSRTWAAIILALLCDNRPKTYLLERAKGSSYRSGEPCYLFALGKMDDDPAITNLFISIIKERARHCDEVAKILIMDGTPGAVEGLRHLLQETLALKTSSSTVNDAASSQKSSLQDTINLCASILCFKGVAEGMELVLTSQSEGWAIEGLYRFYADPRVKAFLDAQLSGKDAIYAALALARANDPSAIPVLTAHLASNWSLAEFGIRRFGKEAIRPLKKVIRTLESDSARKKAKQLVKELKRSKAN